MNDLVALWESYERRPERAVAYSAVKPLLIVAVLALALPINGQEKSSKPAKHETPAEAVKQPAAPQSPVTNSTTSKENQNSGKAPTDADAKETVIIREPAAVPRNKDWWDKAYVIATVLFFVVGALGVRYAIKTLGIIESQLRTMQDQVIEMQNAGKQTERIIARMEDTAVRELRAYVCISTAQMEFIQERAPEAYVRIKNYGKTPAYDVRMWIGMGLGPYPLAVTPPPPPTGFQMSSAVLAPNAKPHAMVMKHPLIEEQAMLILGTPKLTLYVYGEVTYMDAFGNQRSTKYRLMFGGRERATLRDRKGIAVAPLKADTGGNEAT